MVGFRRELVFRVVEDVTFGSFKETSSVSFSISSSHTVGDAVTLIIVLSFGRVNSKGLMLGEVREVLGDYFSDELIKVTAFDEVISVFDVTVYLSDLIVTISLGMA